MRFASLWVLALMLAVDSASAHSAEFSLMPQLTIQGAYDDNTELTPSERKQSVLMVEAPGATFEGSNSAREFYLTYETLLLEHATSTQKNRLFRDNYFALHDLDKIGVNTRLSVDESVLLGNSLGGGIITNDDIPLGPQVMQTLLSNSNTLGSSFALNLQSHYGTSVSWSASVTQTTFSILSNNPDSKYNFAEGASLNVDWNLRERLFAGLGYTFDDFRFSDQAMPTTEAHTIALRLGWGAGTPLSIIAQVGPVIAQNSSGSVAQSTDSSHFSIKPGYFLSGAYDTRRLSIAITCSQAPGLNSGLGGTAIAQTYTALAQYKITRRATVFSNAGYYATSGINGSSDVMAYSSGLSYVLNEKLSLNVNYINYRTLASGPGANVFVSVPGSSIVTNLFIVGVTVYPGRLVWRWG
jgi:hypothetical protein